MDLLDKFYYLKFYFLLFRHFVISRFRVLNTPSLKKDKHQLPATSTILLGYSISLWCHISDIVSYKKLHKIQMAHIFLHKVRKSHFPLLIQNAIFNQTKDPKGIK